MLATGSRLADGSVLANVSFLNIGPNRTTETDLTMRDNSEAVRVIGSFNSESKFIDARTGRETSVLLTAGRGYFVVGLVGVGQEPTDHNIREKTVESFKTSIFKRFGATSMKELRTMLGMEPKI